MATLVQNAIRIKQTFDDIYDAIVEKGVIPTGDVTTYDEAINDIEVGTHAKPSKMEDFIMVCGAEGYGIYSTSTWRVAPLSTYYPIDANYFKRTTSYNFVCQKDGVYQGVLTGGSFGTYSGSTYHSPGAAIVCNNDTSNRICYVNINTPASVATISIGTAVLKEGDIVNLYELGGNNGSRLYLTYAFRMFYIGNK